MKRILLFSVLLMAIISCNKEKSEINNEYLPPSVNSLMSSYDSINRSIDISWSYSNSSEINKFEVYYAPGGGTDFWEVDPYQQYFYIENVSRNSRYLFNVRVVDKNGTRSDGKVIYVDTY